jgi:hypothetical protein
VREGVVELTGPADPTIRRLASLLVRGVPGVVEVRFVEG